MNAQEKVDQLEALINSGKTIFIRNCLHNWKVTPKTFARFASLGQPVFKAIKGNVCMSNGNRYEIIDGCTIEATK